MKVTKFALIFAILVAAGCGSESKSKKEQANDFFEGQLQSTALIQCNQEDHFFDLAEGQCLSEVNLADWTCDRNGLLNQIESDDSSSLHAHINAKSLQTLDEKMKSGFEVNQCGEGSGGSIHVQLIKKSIDGSTASLQSGGLLFLRPSKDS